MVCYRIAVIGLGLIGGSLALRLREKGHYVIGFDQTAETMNTARHLGAVDAVGETAAATVAECDFVFIATPVGVIADTVAEILAAVPPEAIVTDVGSVKRPIMEAVAALQPPFTFIGGHPMAGSERGGIEAADSHLFENAVYALIPAEKKPAQGEKEVVVAGRAEPWQRLHSLIERELGASVIKLQAAVHDEIVASVSHLPHAAAAALVNALGQTARKVPQALALAAGGFRDTTRIASADPRLWADICLNNRAPLLRMIAHLQDQLEQVQEALLTADRAALEEFFQKAQELRARVPVAQKGLIPPLYDVIVPVADVPGAISAVTGLLAAAGLNLKDIEIVRLREGEAGALRLGFAEAEACDRAVSLLQSKGYRAYRR